MKQFVAIKKEARNGYSLTVYQITGRNNPLEFVGRSKMIAYGSDCGADNEAWQVILAKQPRLKTWILKQGGEFNENYHRAYYLIGIDVI